MSQSESKKFLGLIDKTKTKEFLKRGGILLGLIGIGLLGLAAL